jgi:hypothetical protein
MISILNKPRLPSCNVAVFLSDASLSLASTEIRRSLRGTVRTRQSPTSPSLLLSDSVSTSQEKTLVKSFGLPEKSDFLSSKNWPGSDSLH